MNSAAIKSGIVHYAWGLWATSWNGAWSGVGAIAGIDAVAGAGVSENVHMLNWHEMASCFVGSFFAHALLWIIKHPLPEKLPDTDPPFPSTK